MRLAVAFALLAAGVPSAVHAQAPCTAPGYERMDFWLGDWRLSFTGRDGEAAEASNVIRKIEGGCTVEERFDGSASVGFTGRSWSMFDPGSGHWRQTWIDSTGSYLLFEEGPAQDADFELIQTNVAENGPYWRMIWTDVTDEALTWSWQNRVADDDVWSDVWVIRYEKRR